LKGAAGSRDGAEFPATPLPNSFWIEPGRLLAGEYPGSADTAESRARLDALIRAGVSYFVDLTRAGELPAYDHLLPAVRADDERYVIYVRKPITDHSLPARPEDMAEILDYIERAIEVGHQVYVHCRAGIGRTNTVIGCWMRRRGLGGAEAIERLNVLWRANARASSWPHIPETAAQEHYVLTWREPALDLGGDIDLAAARVLRDRYHGSLFGLACGDAIGSTLQYRAPGQFMPVADLLGGGHWQLPRGAWTDDTAVTLCLAESLLSVEGGDAADQLRRYQRWQAEGHMTSTGQCVGITATVARALATVTASDQSAGTGARAESDSIGAADRLPPSGVGARADVYRAPPVRSDAEALVRVGAVAMFAASSPQRVFAWSEAAVEVTHSSPRLLAACRYYAALLLAALRGATRTNLLADARDLLSPYSETLLEPAIRSLVEARDFPQNAGEFPTGSALVGNAAGGTAAGDHATAGTTTGIGARPGDAASALRLVLWVLGDTGGYREGLLRIVNLGGDSDVNGALFGQLAGAYYGAEGIPAAWRSGLLRRDLLADLADRLLAAALAPAD
jgi:ADP-ribosylglycohydrolase/protein-tyrosine phosphatase